MTPEQFRALEQRVNLLANQFRAFQLDTEERLTDLANVVEQLGPPADQRWTTTEILDDNPELT